MHRLLIAVALLLLAPLATAQVYKWTDASGTVHYSEAPPAQGTKYSKVTTSGSVEPLSTSTLQTHTSDSGADRIAPSPAPTTVADTPSNRKSLCDSLNSNLAALHGSGPVVMEKDGKPNALDAAQRQQQIDTAQAQYNQYCQNK
ncbi:MAG TPA: DUF4124 domain-containing protein [Rhodanobacter sp.]|jgi:hypothetical protein|nr:DUF4124 domain-containing protein [Rhodanobacter sp.]